MGGSAFPNLTISRIPHTIYNTLFHQHLKPLLTPYYCILRPPPSPGKTTHGDLDLLALPLGGAGGGFSGSLSTHLSALASTTIKNSPTTSYAIPFPPSLGVGAGIFQLDIHMCVTKHQLQWTFFHHSYGDFCTIIRQLLVGTGLKLDDDGLHIRQGRGLLTLSTDPDEVLRFLGLDVDTFHRGDWRGLEEMFIYIKTCRFFGRGGGGRVEGKKDRKLLRQREGVRVWVEEFLPTCQEEDEGGEGEEDVVALAAEWFGKMEEYKEMVEKAERRGMEEDRWRVVREGLPLKTEREKDLTARLLRARWEMMAETEGELEKFVEENWKEEWRRALQNEKSWSAAFGKPFG
ncbi:hypothetical protein K440DRAFT_634764 [Wilcoxina mikolae CBS 423.85]|nr:hypothetical protein K440DRAFT_634764 [Wilcoxina mikolae CBS 423.85]